MVILAIMKSASELIVPFLVSIVITILISPLFNYLENIRNIPKAISLIVVTILIFLPIIVLIVYLGMEIVSFSIENHRKQNFEFY